MTDYRAGRMGCLVVVLLGLGLTGLSQLWWTHKKQQLIDYARMIESRATRQYAGQPYLRRKVLLLSQDHIGIKAAENLMTNPPGSEALAADLGRDPDDHIGSLVYMKCQDVPVGHYVPVDPNSPGLSNEHAQAYKHHCDVRILDISDPSVTVVVKTFDQWGGDPPARTTMVSERGTSAVPTIIQYLVSLPRL